MVANCAVTFISPPPSLSNCADASSRTLVTQTPNLPYIYSFYKRPNDSLSHLYRESYDTRDLLSFTISAAEWDTFAAADREMSSDMGKIVNMLNNDSQIYYTPVDYLLDTSFHGFTLTSRYAIVFIQIFGLGTSQQAHDVVTTLYKRQTMTS